MARNVKKKRNPPNRLYEPDVLTQVITMRLGQTHYALLQESAARARIYPATQARILLEKALEEGVKLGNDI